MRTREYSAWCAIKTRCNNPKASNYKYYGGRGVRICPEWSDSFERFLADVGPAPSSKHTIDRIDPNGHYEPGNCRWLTHAEQMLNTRKRRVVRSDGLRLVEAAELAGVSVSTMWKRLNRGWSIEEALISND